METFLLDTNHASARWLGDRRLNLFPVDDRFALCYPSLGELWFMVHNSTKRIQNELRLREFISAFQILNFDARAAEEFGLIRTELRKAGRPIKTIDAKIAAIARVNNLIVLTADKHFSYIDGLRHENWLA